MKMVSIIKGKRHIITMSMGEGGWEMSILGGGNHYGGVRTVWFNVISVTRGLDRGREYNFHGEESFKP